MIDLLRLAVATALVLLPGQLVARALGQRGSSATLVWAKYDVTPFTPSAKNMYAAAMPTAVASPMIRPKPYVV